MITNYNYVTNQEQKWYSEEEYNGLEEKYIKVLRKLGAKIKEKEHERKYNGISNSNSSYTNCNNNTDKYVYIDYKKQIG